MHLKDPEAWLKWQENNTDGYGGACIKTAKQVMEYLDEDQPFDANELILKTYNELNIGITVFMAGAVAQIVTQCHERGDEFQVSWNEHYGVKVNDSKRTVNPALVTIDVEEETK